MGELVFIGLGLHDEKGLTLAGLEEARSCDALFLERYTSAMFGTSTEALGKLTGKVIRPLGREDIEKAETILKAATTSKVGLLVGGDPMVATTHVDLRLRAARAGIRTRIVHGVSILSAAAGTLGLQAYRFGRTTTVPFPAPGFEPTSPLEMILKNREAGLHTLVLLDLREDGTSLAPGDAIRFLLRTAERKDAKDFGAGTLACVLSRVGSPEVRAVAGPIGRLASKDLGPPLHCLVVPGSLHFLEREALMVFAGAPQDV